MVAQDKGSYRDYYTGLAAHSPIRIQAMALDAKQTSWTTLSEVDGIKARLLRHQGLEAEKRPITLLDIGSGVSNIPTMIFPKERILKAIRIDPIYSDPACAKLCEWGDPVAATIQDSVPVNDGVFDVVTAFDCLCHMGERHQLLGMLIKTLRPGGLLLISDSLVLSGSITAAEVASRSYFGRYTIVPDGFNERNLARSGAKVLWRWDTTKDAVKVFEKFERGRSHHRDRLSLLEGEITFEKMGSYLKICRDLLARNVLKRVLICARREV